MCIMVVLLGVNVGDGVGLCLDFRKRSCSLPDKRGEEIEVLIYFDKIIDNTR